MNGPKFNVLNLWMVQTLTRYWQYWRKKEIKQGGRNKKYHLQCNIIKRIMKVNSNKTLKMLSKTSCHLIICHHAQETNCFHIASMQEQNNRHLTQVVCLSLCCMYTVPFSHWLKNSNKKQNLAPPETLKPSTIDLLTPCGWQRSTNQHLHTNTPP